jgi:hypothetical protein
MNANIDCNVSGIFWLLLQGWVILRDRSELIEDVRVWASRRSWETRVVYVDESGDQQLLVCQKPAWRRSLSSAAS